MYLVFTETHNYKVSSIPHAEQFLQAAGIGDLGGLREDLRENDAWYSDPQRCGVEKQTANELKDVDYAPI